MKNPFLATMPLTMTVHGKGDEIHAIIRAAWPFMVLTPREVHAFARLLSRAADALYQRKPCTPDSFTQEALATTDARLEKKLQFIPLSPCLDYPALLDLCDNEIELTADELLTLEVDVMMLAVSLPDEQTLGWLARTGIWEGCSHRHACLDAWRATHTLEVKS